MTIIKTLFKISSVVMLIFVSQSSKAAWGELKTLDPRPARRFIDDFVPKVTPDMWLEIDFTDHTVVSVNYVPD